MKVIIISQKNEFSQNHIDKIRKYAEVVWIDKDETDLMKVRELFDPEEKIVALSPVPLGWKIDPGFYNKLQNLKAVCLATTAYDYLNVSVLREQRIIVTNVPYYSTNAVAEYAFFMFMALLKKFPQQLKSGFKYEFSDMNLMDEFDGKTVGIIGLGNVGSKIAYMVKELGFKIIYWSRDKKNNEFRFVSLNEVISQSDVVFPTFISSKESKDLLKKEILINLKDSAYFINIIGEEICDTDYLLARAENNNLTGLAFESGKRKMEDYTGNIFITAPLAWYTKQSLKRNIDIWTDTIISCVKCTPINSV